MTSDKFNLTWHAFQTHTNELLSELYKSTEYTDVTLVCDDKTQLKAHKFVLSSCSSVFKSILDSSFSSPFIYLRGISKDEMVSILQFMYLGKTTVYQHRINEFLNAAKDLDLKEIGHCLDANDDPNSDEQANFGNLSEAKIKQEPLKRSLIDYDYETAKRTVSKVSDKEGFQCESCHKNYASKWSLIAHVESNHNGLRFPCEQCDFQATQRGSLMAHIKSKHEGVRYPCTKCDYKATHKQSLNSHIKSKHEGVRYQCHYCDLVAPLQSTLINHVKNKHK